MLEKLTGFVDYFRKIPAAFLVAITTVLVLILFLPDKYASTLAVDGFRDKYRVFLGPTLLLFVGITSARIYLFFMQGHNQRKALKRKQESLHKLTPEEKGYLVLYIQEQETSVYVGLEDGIMSGLCAKGITYRAANIGSMLDGFAFNLQPWAREYLELYPYLLEGFAGRPMTPQQRLNARW